MVASLFKLWLRELEEPLIPTALYNDALIASKDYRQVVEIVQKLPVYNRRVLVFVVSFVQIFIQEKVVEKTKMGPMNLGTFETLIRSFSLRDRDTKKKKKKLIGEKNESARAGAQYSANYCRLAGHGVHQFEL